MTDKLQGTCSVCLRTIQLRGDRPIRHGFSAIGVRHGTHSGYHTGPCGGSNFPHLGISTEGTVWALGVAHNRLDSTIEALRKLDAFPDLTWHRPLPTFIQRPGPERHGLPDTTKSVTLRHGADVPYANDGRPSYAHEHKKRVAELTNVKNELERAIAAYEKILATWKPESAAAAPAKVEIVHLAKDVRGNFGNWTGIACRSTRRMNPHAREKLLKTSDVTKVTCKACKKILGLPT